MIGRGDGRVESKKSKFSLGLAVFASIVRGKGSVISCAPSLYTSARAAEGKLITKAIIKYLTLCLLIFIPFLQSSEAQQQAPRSHYTYLDGSNKLADLFYNNNNYYQCKKDRHCQIQKDGPLVSKRIALFVRDKKTGLVIPSFIQCFNDGTATAAMEESLIPLVNQALNNEPCLDLNAQQGNIPRRLLKDTIQTLEGLDEHGCPREDRSCAQQIFSLFEKDINNLFRPFSSAPSPTTEMGCLSTLIANVLDGLWQIAKLVAYEIPRGIFRAGANAWNYFFNKEADTSSAMLYASVMSESMAEALADGDFAKFYTELRTNFFSFLGAIREFYSQLMGCMEWEGMPFDSECLRRTNWSCPTCESVTNFLCGLTGQLGTGMALGAIMGVTKAGASLARMRRQIAQEPQKYGLTPGMAEQLRATESLQGAKRALQETRYRAGLVTNPVSNFMNTALGEMKTLFAVGENFKKLVSINPVTAPFHMAFQSGQRVGHRSFNRLASEGNVPGLSLGPTATLGRSYGRALANIQLSMQDKMADLYRIRGSNFNPTIYNDISRRYIADVKRELERVNIKATPIQGGRGLRLEKGGQVFEYRPNFRQKLDATPSSMNLDEFRNFINQMDPFLDTITPTSRLTPELPSFIRDVHQKSKAAQNTYVIHSGAEDGLAYLAYFTAQSTNVPQTQRCEDLLYNMELIGSHDVTERAQPAAEDLEVPSTP
jgi:hypothetical protein